MQRSQIVQYKAQVEVVRAVLSIKDARGTLKQHSEFRVPLFCPIEIGYTPESLK